MSDGPDDTVDTGFDAVLAGERFEPEPAAGMQAPHNSGERLPLSDPAEPAAGPSLPAISPEPNITATVTDPGLTTEGIEAAKALVRLPAISTADLARLAREFALNVKERHVILKEFGLDNAQYDFLERHNPFYRKALETACIQWQGPLTTTERLQIQAAAILEDSLPSLGARMQNKGEGLPGVVEAAKLFAKVAGAGEQKSGGGAPGERFTINIDLGGDQKITVASSPPPEASTKPGARLSIPGITET